MTIQGHCAAFTVYGHGRCCDLCHSSDAKYGSYIGDPPVYVCCEINKLIRRHEVHFSNETISALMMAYRLEIAIEGGTID